MTWKQFASQESPLVLCLQDLQDNAINYDRGDDCWDISRCCMPSKLATRDVLLELACCGIRFKLDHFLTIPVSPGSLPEIIPFLDNFLILPDSFMSGLFGALAYLCWNLQGRARIVAALIQLPVAKAALLANLDKFLLKCLSDLHKRGEPSSSYELFSIAVDADPELMARALNKFVHVERGRTRETLLYHDEEVDADDEDVDEGDVMVDEEVEEDDEDDEDPYSDHYVRKKNPYAKTGYRSKVLHRACLHGDAVVLDLALALPGLNLKPVDSLRRRPIDVLPRCHIMKVIFGVHPDRLSRLVATDPSRFLQKLGRALGVESDAVITSLARNDANRFTATLCSLIGSCRHQLLPIESALVSAD
jgi:hypothetical protein